jgi:hypothetical protein
MSKVINCKKANLVKLGFKDLEDALKNPDYVYIGRDMTYYINGAIGSKWQNPFKVTEYGRDECLSKYKEYLLSNKKLMSDIKELKGKTLMCWCAPEKCHGDILMELANN